jgi:hypothetical protein|tara:strand:+ start:3283 stop:3702 length:420 start_codon:yes stop_codon:yes gene_type:complete
MKLYVTPTGEWTGTQTDAKKLAKQHNTTCDVFEVPVDKKGLLDFLNEHQVSINSGLESRITEVTTPVVAGREEEVKIVGQTREAYMRNWRQEQADWNSEYKCNEAIETVLWDAPNQFLGNYIAIIIDRMTNLKEENEDE